jgi:hypothetical protein
MKRLTITEYDGLHVYEWLRMYWRGNENRFGGCYECERLGRRLERLIGPPAVRRVARLVKDNPGTMPKRPAVARAKKKHAKQGEGPSR